MKTIQYKNFAVSTNLDEPVSQDNYFKNDICIYDTDGNFVTRIFAGELWKYQVEGFLSENEELAQRALDYVIENREQHLRELKDFNTYKVITWPH